ncbi:MAG: hypothetical protein U0Q18_02290 [Bryobacteraceae bacterium]
MKHSIVSLLWQQSAVTRQFDTAVCLHGHTMHSEECLSFLPTYLSKVPGIAQIVGGYQRGPQPAVDFARAFWTPPLAPACAMDLERRQIADLGLRPIVSLTDHDNIEAGIDLQLTQGEEDIPLSVEWTVPYEQSILHLGIHNLPRGNARSWMSTMAAYTASPNEAVLPDILSELARIPGLLIVLNHPFWLEEGVTEAQHQPALSNAIRRCNTWFHAFELNGTRRWNENRAVLELAREWSRPVISGGDRHACEPSACLNLTNARSFDDFAEEIRNGHSSVAFMKHYREPMPVRVTETIWDIVRNYPQYAGRECWTDRVFYRGEDGTARPLSLVWKDRVPWFIHPVRGMLQLSAMPGMRVTLRYLLARQAEVLE